MEVYFNGLEQVNGNKRGNQRGADRAVSADIDWSQARPMERSDTPHNDGRDGVMQEHRPDIPVADTGRNRRVNDIRGEEELQLDGTGSQERNEQGGEFNRFTDHNYNEISDEYNNEYEFEYDGTDENEGFDTVEDQSKVDHDWGDIANSVIALGASVEAMVDKDDNDRKKQQKKQKKQGNNHKKKQQHKDDYDLSM